MDAFVDLTPAATSQVSVRDDSGTVDPIGWHLPPLGAGVEVVFSQFGALDLSASLDVAQRTPGYDIALDWAPTLWSAELDFGPRIHMITEPRAFALDFVAGPGVRAELIAQPWWRDYAYWGIGGHVGFAATIGPGDVRLLLGVRASVALVPGAVQGVVDSGVQDLTWDYAPLAARLAVHAGVALR